MTVLQIQRPETTQVANYLLDRLGKGQVTAELLQPDELISGMMAQVAAEPDMAQLLTGFIYSSEGRIAQTIQCAAAFTPVLSIPVHRRNGLDISISGEPQQEAVPQLPCMHQSCFGDALKFAVRLLQSVRAHLAMKPIGGADEFSTWQLDLYVA